MRIGGGGNEVWLFVIPVAFAAFVITIYLGGPGDALTLAERLLYDLLDAVRSAFRS